jgi:hypothetical protein
MLDYEAKRRPALAALVDRIDLLDEATIRAAPVMPWMRQALALLKQEHRRDSLEASMDQWATHGQNPDPIGEMRRWEGMDTFVKVGRTQLEICAGHLIWIAQNGVWIDTIFSSLIDPLLFSNTCSCGEVRRSEYMEAIRARTRQLCPDANLPQPMERVRFYRPG